jgi:FkbM family methyltransferase
MKKSSELMVCHYLKKTPEAFYDIGVGPKSEWITLHKKYPSMKLYGCEPHTNMYHKLLATFPGDIIHVAISNYSGKGVLNAYPEDDGRQSSLMDRNKNSVAIPIDIWTLDEFDKHFNSPEDIILWMDIEGSELKALQGGIELLSSGRILAINLEVRDDVRGVSGWCTATEVDDFLITYGYKMVKKYMDHGTHWDVIYTK